LNILPRKALAINNLRRGLPRKLLKTKISDFSFFRQAAKGDIRYFTSLESAAYEILPA
jgi:hypothetical protein